MSDFDKECPRCKGQSIPKAPPATQTAPVAAVPVAPSKPTPPKAEVDQNTQKTAKGCCGCMTIFVLLLIIGSLFSPKSDNSPGDYLVKNSEWDSAVPAVVNYLKKNLNDPDSVQYIEWSKVNIVTSDTSSYKYWVRCKYRAKNGFGGYVIQNQIFYLDKDGGVINVKDLG